ncbi:MAG: hypothetical protein ACOCW2_02100 [Chitinivibrionales bacterium]
MQSWKLPLLFLLMCGIAGSQTIQNTVHLDSLSYDSATHDIHVFWSVDADGDQTDELAVGIGYSFDGYEAEPNEIVQHKIVQQCQDSVTLHYRERFLFDTTYFVSLYLGDGQGTWSSATENSCASIQTPPFDHQTVVYFEEGVLQAGVFNNTILFRRDSPDEVGVNHDTVLIYNLNSQRLHGFVSAGPGFQLARAVQDDPFYIGIRITALPGGIHKNDLHLYRVDEDSTVRVVYESFVEDDVVWMRTEPTDMKAAYVLLADTLEPQLEIPDPVDTSQAVDPATQEISQQFSIRDNVSNAVYTVFAGEGNKSTFDHVKSDTLSMVSAEIAENIPRRCANTLNGLRAHIVITDGVHNDTVDISRCVISPDIGQVPTPVNQGWAPLAVRGKLHDSTITTVLDELEDGGETGWEYDIYKFRLFQYVGNGIPQADGQGWLEYADTVSQFFHVVPGRVLWLKTHDAMVIKLGKGLTTSLKETFELTLEPGRWTDFTTPFQFDVPFRAVMDSTGADIDSLQIYHWKRNEEGTNITYSADDFYISTFDSIAASASQDVFHSEVGHYAYTVYNPLQRPVTLRIPPVVAGEGTAKKRVAQHRHRSQWGVGFDWQEAGQAGSRMIRCVVEHAMSESQRVYALAPSFNSIGAAVVDTLNNTLGGHVLTRDNNSQGFAWQIALFNRGKETKTITYTLRNLSSLPPHFKAGLWDAQTESFKPLSGNREQEILEPSSEKTKWVIAGTDEYIARFTKNLPGSSLVLAGCFPNPFAGRLSIRYSVPQRNLTQVSFGMYDLRGRLVWRHVEKTPRPGKHLFTWDGLSCDNQNVGAGQYVLRMTAQTADGVQKVVGEQGITYLP